MSRAGRFGKKKVASSDEEEESPPKPAATARSKKKAASAVDDDDFPKLDFDMGDLEAELKESEPTPPPRKSRFPTRPALTSKDSSSAPSSRGSSRPSSRKASPERQHLVTMEELDRWRWSSTYSHEGDQDEFRLAQNMQAWSKVPIPDAEHTDVAATMMFRKYLWRHKRLARDGIPPEHRLFVWEVLSGAKTMPDRMEHLNRYKYYVSQVGNLTTKQRREIGADAPRALNGHPKFAKSPEGVEELKNILSAFAIRNPTIGYVNPLSHIAAYFLLYYSEEQAFWILCAIVDIVLPVDYFTQSLLGVRAECMLLRILVFQRIPKLHAHLTSLGVDVYNVALKWLMTLYLLCLSKECIARVLDVLFLEGSNILVTLGLSFFVVHEKELLEIEDTMEMMDAISKLGTEYTDNDELMRTLLKDSRCKIGEEEDKRRQVERKVMENDYMKELQKTQLHRKAEEARFKEAADALAKREQEEIEAVGMGCEMYKVGQHGDAKLTHVSLEKFGSDWLITWRSKRKKGDEAQMKISECTLHFGLRHGNFHSRPEFAKKFLTAKKMSFTIQSPTRSLDLVCQTSHDFEIFKKIFFKPGFPFKNEKSIQLLRRRIEKKKTIKRTAAARAGKNVASLRIESSDSDYDHSGEEDADADAKDAAAAIAAASSSSSSRFTGGANLKRLTSASSATTTKEKNESNTTTTRKKSIFAARRKKEESEEEEEGSDG